MAFWLVFCCQDRQLTLCSLFAVPRLQMRRSGAISGGLDSPLAQLSTEVAEREAALTKQLAAAEARAQSAAAERDAIKVRVKGSSRCSCSAGAVAY